MSFHHSARLNSFQYFCLKNEVAILQPLSFLAMYKYKSSWTMYVDSETPLMYFDSYVFIRKSPSL